MREEQSDAWRQGRREIDARGRVQNRQLPPAARDCHAPPSGGLRLRAGLWAGLKVELHIEAPWNRVATEECAQHARHLSHVPRRRADGRLPRRRGNRLRAAAGAAASATGMAAGGLAATSTQRQQQPSERGEAALFCARQSPQLQPPLDAPKGHSDGRRGVCWAPGRVRGGTHGLEPHDVVDGALQVHGEVQRDDRMPSTPLDGQDRHPGFVDELRAEVVMFASEEELNLAQNFHGIDILRRGLRETYHIDVAAGGL
mmetsp:Transcript_95296/g.246770  ORF Transcript_95296/g.246770 Transcript_95296/m.246770 type:complete len:257 (-) Transcript_95296:1304-2074(-)